MMNCVLEIVDGQPRCKCCSRSLPARFGLNTKRNCLCRADGTKPPVATATFPPDPNGPGQQLKQVILELGPTINGSGGCKCESYALQMDAWGVSGCRERRDEIIARLQDQAGKASWLTWLSAVATGAFAPPAWFIRLDPFGSMVDEAVRRAEAAATPALATSPSPALPSQP